MAHFALRVGIGLKAVGGIINKRDTFEQENAVHKVVGWLCRVGRAPCTGASHTRTGVSHDS